MSRTYTCTIDPALFEAWTKQKRRNDVQAISEYIEQRGEKFSKPVIQNALKYGFIGYSTSLQDHITQFFEARKAKEKAEAQTLK